MIVKRWMLWKQIPLPMCFISSSFIVVTSREICESANGKSGEEIKYFHIRKVRRQTEAGLGVPLMYLGIRWNIRVIIIKTKTRGSTHNLLISENQTLDLCYLYFTKFNYVSPWYRYVWYSKRSQNRIDIKYRHRERSPAGVFFWGMSIVNRDSRIELLRWKKRGFSTLAGKVSMAQRTQIDLWVVNVY